MGMGDKITAQPIGYSGTPLAKSLVLRQALTLPWLMRPNATLTYLQICPLT